MGVKGLKWIYNPNTLKTTTIRKELPIPDGWCKGRPPLTNEQKHKISVSTKIAMEKCDKTNIIAAAKANSVKAVARLKKYYEENPLQRSINATKQCQKGIKKRWFFNDIYFDSSWELIFFLATNANKCHKSFQYTVNGKEHLYTPDFELDGKLYEIKGPQFFENEKMINPFDRSQDALYEAKHICGINNGVIFVTDIEPYKKIVEERYCPDFWNLLKSDLPFPYTDDVYRCHKKGLPSPFDAWSDTVLRTKAALNRVKYGRYAEGSIAKIAPEDIVTAFSVMKIAPKVSEFSTRRAQRLIKEYLWDANNIVDPFAGFGGRKKGCEMSNKKYYGFDIEIKNSLDITQRDILSDYPVEKYDALFTCPPYGDKEIWLNDMPSIKSCDEWIDVCLEKFKCNKYLFVVDYTEKYKDYIVDYIKNSSSLTKKGATECVILITY